MEVIWRKRRDAAQTINVELLMEMCIDGLEYFEQASLIAVGVLCGALALWVPAGTRALGPLLRRSTDGMIAAST
jgi:hypothetical protein